jgi:hypothetical protein
MLLFGIVELLLLRSSRFLSALLRVEINGGARKAARRHGVIRINNMFADERMANGAAVERLSGVESGTPVWGSTVLGGWPVAGPDLNAEAAETQRGTEKIGRREIRAAIQSYQHATLNHADTKSLDLVFGH